MTAGRAERLLIRLQEIEAEIAALYAEMDAMDAEMDEHERPGRYVGYACDVPDPDAATWRPCAALTEAERHAELVSAIASTLSDDEA